MLDNDQALEFSRQIAYALVELGITDVEDAVTFIAGTAWGFAKKANPELQTLILGEEGMQFVMKGDTV